jgi:hypothetical protein
MTSFLAATVLLLLLAGIWVLLERTHRRTAGMPRAPFGADPRRESDLWRVWHDLDVAARR